MSTIDKYRAQQGLKPDVSSSYSPDQQLITWIKQASSATGADPVALLATSLQESGGKLHGPAGDKGTSFGPFQFHIGGALANHPPSWASTYAAILNRATEFARLGVRGGRGAAAVQRPADPKLYAMGVDSLMGQAHAILEKMGGGASGGASPSATGLSSLASSKAFSFHAQSGPAAAVDILESKSPGEARLRYEAAKKAYKVPAQKFKPSVMTPMAQMGGSGSPVTGSFKLIGLPNQGTHTLYGNWESDNAIDIQVPAHTPIYATTDGVIGSQFGHINTGDAHMAGLRLHLNGAAGNFYYQHLQSAVVKPGQKVTKGQLLGYSGALNHLHFAVQNGDPRSYYK